MNKTEIKQIHARGEELRDFIVETTIEIARVRTVNYDPADYPGEGPDGMDLPGHEARVVERLERVLDGWHLPHHREGRIPERPALFASVGRKEKGARRMMLLLHTDTVPSGDRSAWRFDPFDAHEKGGKLYGRGVLDNKGPLVSALAAFKIISEQAEQIPGEVIFAALPDEEVQAGYGLDWLLANGKIACDEAVVPDIAGEMKEINIAEKGRLGLSITVRGKSAHAMDPSQGVSAAYGLAQLVLELEKMKMPHTKHPILGRPTLNVGIIKGGNAANAVPDLAQAVVDIRYVPGQKEAAIKKQIKDLCAGIAKKRKGLRFTVEARRGAPPIAVKPDAPIVKTILAHAPKAQIVGTGGGTFAHALVEQGIDAVGWSPGNEKTYHQANEEIAVKQLTTYAGRLAAVVLDRVAG
ncbi:MAG: M20/M25/M40 family metallo-hydrolase [Deltaproteobacteria bacterium]|nr:M20/M25/M40 family metallo-hydrolase [Deltaproteobacteria bacterium]